MTTNLTKQGLPRPKDGVWRSYVEEWDRSLRAANRPHTTRYNYQLAVTQLSDFLGGPELPAFLKKMDMPADDEIASLLEACRGKSYSDRRDTAIIRLSWIPVPGSARSRACNWITSISSVTVFLSVAKETASASCPSVNAQGRPSAGISAPGRGTRRQTSLTYFSLNEDGKHSSRTASKSCYADAGSLPAFHTCMLTDYGTHCLTCGGESRATNPTLWPSWGGAPPRCSADMLPAPLQNEPRTRIGH